MEQVRDLNMEADDMQVVLSAISGVSKRIKEVGQTHKPLIYYQMCQRTCPSLRNRYRQVSGWEARTASNT